MKNDTASDINHEKEDDKRSEQLRLFRTIALIAVIASVVLFGSLKSLWRDSEKPEKPEKSATNATSRTESSQTSGLSPLTENQSVRLKSGAEKFVVSDDGRKLVTFAEFSSVVYFVGTEESILLKGAPQQFFRNGDFLPNGDFVMGGELEAGIWDTMTGTKKMTLKAEGGIEAVAASPDGLTIAGVSRADGRIWIWETQTGAVIKESKADGSSLRPSIIFENPGHLLVYEISRSRARVVDVEIATMKFTPGEWQNSGADTNLKFSVRGKWLTGGSIEREFDDPENFVVEGNTVTGIKESELRVFESKTVTQSGLIKLGLNGSGEMVDERRAITTSGEGDVGMVDLEAKQITNVMKLNGRTRIVAVSKNGRAAVIKIGEREAVVFPVPQN